MPGVIPSFMPCVTSFLIRIGRFDSSLIVPAKTRTGKGYLLRVECSLNLGRRVAEHGQTPRTPRGRYSRPIRS